MPDLKLNVTKLNKSYGATPVLQDLTLAISHPGIYTILGINGVGKTTLLKCLAELLKINSGSFEIAKPVSFVPETTGMYGFLTGYEYLDFAMAFKSIENNHRKKAIAEVIKIFDLTKIKDTLIVNYSNGMKQKLSLAAAFLTDPATLLLDEPLTGIDLVTSHRIKQFLISEKKRRIIIITSHVMEIAKSVSDEILIMVNGSITKRFNKELFDELNLEQLINNES